MKNNQPILSISVAANLLGLHPRTLMSYEKAKILFPHKTTTNRRMYTPNDLYYIQFLKHLTDDRHININGVKYIMEAIRMAEGKGIDLKRALFPEFRPRDLL